MRKSVDRTADALLPLTLARKDMWQSRIGQKRVRKRASKRLSRTPRRTAESSLDTALRQHQGKEGFKPELYEPQPERREDELAEKYEILPRTASRNSGRSRVEEEKKEGGVESEDITVRPELPVPRFESVKGGGNDRGTSSRSNNAISL